MMGIGCGRVDLGNAQPSPIITETTKKANAADADAAQPTFFVPGRTAGMAARSSGTASAS